VADGEAGRLGETGPYCLLQRLLVALSQVTQLRYGRIIVEGIGSKRRRPHDKLMDLGRSHALHTSELLMTGKLDAGRLWINRVQDIRRRLNFEPTYWKGDMPVI
jgi:hypothetical protein